jgi:hypothetical protein
VNQNAPDGARRLTLRERCERILNDLEIAVRGGPPQVVPEVNSASQRAARADTEGCTDVPVETLGGPAESPRNLPIGARSSHAQPWPRRIFPAKQKSQKKQKNVRNMPISAV